MYVEVHYNNILYYTNNCVGIKSSRPLFGGCVDVICHTFNALHYSPSLALNFHGRVSRDGDATIIICLWLTIFFIYLRRSICNWGGGGTDGAHIYDPIVFISRRARAHTPLQYHNIIRILLLLLLLLCSTDVQQTVL